MSLDVSVVIVSYKVKALVLNCLESLFLYCLKDEVEIILVDNCSEDGTVESVQGKFPDVTVIANLSNTGFPAANNQGFKVARGKYIFMLNPDTELLEDSVTILKEFLDKNADAILVAPQLLNEDQSIQRSIFRFPKIRYILAEMFYLERLTQNKYYHDKNSNDTFEVDSASGAALFFRKSIFSNVGMLNEKLFWIEDIDFCYRIRKAGGKIVYLPQTHIVHYSGQSAKRNYSVSVSNQIVNKMKYFKLHESRFRFIIVSLLSYINTLIRLLVFTFLAPFNRIYFLKMKAYFHTFRILYRATEEL